MKKFFVAAVLALFAGIGMTMAQMPDVKIENHQGNVIQRINAQTAHHALSKQHFIEKPPFVACIIVFSLKIR